MLLCRQILNLIYLKSNFSQGTDVKHLDIVREPGYDFENIQPRGNSCSVLLGLSQVINMSQLGLVIVEKSSLSKKKSERINAKQPKKQKNKTPSIHCSACRRDEGKR